MQAIVAVDENWGIGKDNQLLFTLPKDLQFFKEKTFDKIVVMGRKTLQSLPKSQPLKNRINIILSTSTLNIENAICVNNHTDLFQVLKEYNSNDIFVIGGAMVYKDLLPYCSYAWVTKVFANGSATHFFENLEHLENWQKIEAMPIQVDNGYTFQVYKYQNNKIKKF